MVASGRAHDRATWYLALPFGLLWWPLQGVAAAMAAGLAFLIGGLLLSPDLDIHSRPTARWGALGVLWWPYRRLLRHRSLLSHSPLLGTAGRLTYLGGVVVGLAALVHPLGGPSPTSLWALGLLIWQQHRELVIAAVVGVEASNWLHLIQDGAPMPRRRRRRRRR